MDRYRGIVGLPLLEARVNHLLDRLQNNLSFGSFQTQEELVRAYADIAARIGRGNDTAIYDLPRPVAGGTINESDLNAAFLGLYSEIIYLLSATKGSATLAESNFNFAAAAIRDIQSGVKRIRQQLAVYSLYTSRFGDSRFYGETFSTEENIDRGSSFLREKECSISLNDGTVSLPKKGEDQWKIQKIEVGSVSNGVLGNNVEAGAPIRGALSSLYDGNVDTWTEYERVVSAEDADGLRLELKISLDDVRVVNSLRIHPILLGARTAPVIDEAKVSSDGRAWVSLKTEVRAAEFIGEKQEDCFHLSPGSSRFAGEFNITFAPRFVKFISLVIRQSSTFPITDVYGATRFRYAIAIKEIVAYGFKYEASGELVSKPVSPGGEFSVVSIISLVDPPLVPREVGGAEYYLSFDDGTSWNQLTSMEDASTEIEEVLSPENPVSSLRWKVKLFKDESVFEKSIPRPLANTREVYNYLDRNTQLIKLLHRPKAGTISVCDPSIGSRGKLYPKMVLGKGVFSELKHDGGTWERHGNTQLKLEVPLKEIDNPDDIYVYVNNMQVTRVKDWTSGTRFSRHCVVQRSADASSGLDDSTLEVVFGNDDGANPIGMIPGPTDTVSISFPPEDVAIEGIVAPYTLRLAYPSNGNKKDTQVKFLGQPTMIATTEFVPPGVFKFKFQSDHIRLDETTSPVLRMQIDGVDVSGHSVGTSASYVGSSAIPGSSSFIRYRVFVDGSSELDLAGDWTVDPIRGFLYVKTAVDNTYSYVLSYYPDPGVYLDEADWDFATGKLDEITVYESGYHSVEAVEAVASSVKSVDLTNATGIVPKSVRIVGQIFGSAITPFEVPYINGMDEFETFGKIQDEEIPVATAVGIPAIAKFQLTHYENLVSTSGFLFSSLTAPSSTFTTMVTNYASLTNTGDYYIDTTGTGGPDGLGYVYVVLSGVGVSIPSGETVAYYYRDTYSAERMRGAYSVDQKNGRVFFSELLTATGTIKYKYTPYSVIYNISREFSEGEGWRLKEDGQTIVLSPPSGTMMSGKVSILYDYELESLNVADLAPYYSPLLRALAVKVA